MAPGNPSTPPPSSSLGADNPAPANRSSTTRDSPSDIRKIHLLSEFQNTFSERRWLAQPSNNSQPSLAGSLFETILNMLVMTAQVAGAEHSRRLRSALQRLFLWGDSFSVSAGKLDKTISKSSELFQTVLFALCGLGKIIIEDLTRVFGTPNGAEDATMKLNILLEKAASVLGTYEVQTGIESWSDDESIHYDLSEILHDIEIYIDCLMDLSTALESPIIGRTLDSNAQTFEVLQTSISKDSQDSVNSESDSSLDVKIDTYSKSYRMLDKSDEKQIPQNTSSRYLQKTAIQEMLERLFPGQKEFNIRVNNISLLDKCNADLQAQLKDDRWYFAAPRKVEKVS